MGYSKRFVNMLHRYLTVALLWMVTGFAGMAPAAAVAAGEPVDAAERLRVGQQAFDAGDFSQALDQWARAADAYQSAGDLAGQSQALLRKGMAYLALGRYPRAQAALTQARELAEQAGDSALGLRAAIGLGTAQALAGNAAEAKTLLEQGLSAASAQGQRDLAAAAGMELGNLLAAEGRNDEAVSRYRQSLADAEALGDRTLAAKAAVNLARALLESGRGAEAWSAVSAADARVRALAPSHDRAFLLVSLGGLYRDAAGLVPAQAAEAGRRAAGAYQAAADTARAIGDMPTLSYALGYQGELREDAGDYGAALASAEQAALHARQAQAPESLYRWEWLTGRLLQRQGDSAGAIAAYRRAINNLERIRHDLATTQRRGALSFRAEYGVLYLEYADLLLRYAAQTADAAQREQYLRGAREAVELLKSAEIEDYFQDDCVTALKAKTSGIDRLASDTAAIYPIVLPDRLEILVSLPDGMRRFVTPVGAAQVNDEVRRLRQLLEKRTTREYLRPAQQLYDWVLRPVEGELRRAGIRTLVIVPDGSLRTIPLAALHDGQQFVLERYAVSTTPGLTLTDPRPIRRERVQVLAAGLTEAVQGFPPLPAVDQELKAISGLYEGEVLENEAFSIANVEAELESGRPYDIVHVASHGQFESDVNDSFLLTSDSRLTMDKLEGYMGVTAYRDRPVELLTLSACQTAVGDDRAALGLAGVAIKAGARSAVATLWSVNDRASSELVAEFYRQLRDPALSKADALRQAQLALLQDSRYGHPLYWSPFLLIGNWL
jgi:CHAT domain-containing protein